MIFRHQVHRLEQVFAMYRLATEALDRVQSGQGMVIERFSIAVNVRAKERLHGLCFF